MALVRKSMDIRYEITYNIQQLKQEKIKKIIEKSGAVKIFTDFLNNLFESDLLFDRSTRAWLENAPSDLYPFFLGMKPIQINVGLSVPGAETPWRATGKKKYHESCGYGTEFTVLDSAVYPMSFPMLRKAFSFNHESGFKFIIGPSSQGLGYNRNNEINLAFSMGRCFQEGSPEPKMVVKFYDAPRGGQDKNWDAIMDTALRRERNMFGDEDLEPFAMYLDDLRDIQVAINKASERLVKTENYIFSELWKLNSINKMTEFFPGLRAFLSDDTLARMDRGNKKKPAISIAHPDEDIIVSATEASIK